MNKQLAFKNRFQLSSIITIASEVGKKPNDLCESRIL